MIKKSLIVASLLFAGTSAVAQNEYFMGAGISGGSLTPKVVETNSEGAVISTTSESDNGGVFSILGGTIIDNKHKLSIGYSTYLTDDTDADVEMNSIDLGYAYFIDQDILKITNKKWKPFVGVGYSMSIYKQNLSSSYNQSEFKLTTKALLIGIGTDYEIDKNQFITIGYDISLSTSGNENATLTTGKNTNVEFDKISRCLVAYHYKF